MIASARVRCTTAEVPGTVAHLPRQRNACVYVLQLLYLSAPGRGSGGAPNATSTLPASAGAKQATAQAPAAASAVAAYGRHLLYQPRRPGHQRHRAECGGCDKFFRFTGLLRWRIRVSEQSRCLLHRDVQFDAADRRDYRQRLRRIDRVHGGVRNGSKGGCVVSGRLPL